MSFFPTGSHLSVEDTDGVDWQWNTNDDDDDNPLTENIATREQDQVSVTMTAEPSQRLVTPVSGLEKHFKRPLGVSEIDSTHDLAKRRKLNMPPPPQCSSARSLTGSTGSAYSAPATAVNRPATAKPRKPVKNPFESDLEGSDEEPSTTPAPASVVVPRNASSVQRAILEHDPQRVLAEAARWREQARVRKEKEQLKRAMSVKPEIRPKEQRNADSRLSTPLQNGKETSQPRPNETLGQRLQSLPRKDARFEARLTPKSVADPFRDRDHARAATPRGNSIELGADFLQRRARAHLRQSSPINTKQSDGESSFSERVEALKKQFRSRSVAPTPFAPQASDCGASPPTSSETEEARRDRLAADALHKSAEKLAQERKAVREQVKALEMQRRQKRDSDTASGKHDKEEQERIEEQKARKATMELLRQREQEARERIQADKERNEQLDRQLAQLREENKKKRAEAEAKEAKAWAEEQKRRADKTKHSVTDKSTEHGRRPSTLDDEARKARDERIQQKKERSARNRQAEQDEDQPDELVVEEPPSTQRKSLAQRAREARGDSQKRDAETAAYKPTATLTARPISLNSAAGVKVLGDSLRTDRSDDVKHGRELDLQVLGEITHEDVKLLHWRDTGDSWVDLMTKIQNLTGRTRTEGALKARYAKVMEAMNHVHVAHSLRQRMFMGDEDARREINTAIRGQWPIKGNNLKGEDRTDLTRRTVQSDLLPSPGEILPIDALLVQWRRESKTWAQIITLHESLTGKRRGEHWLRERTTAVNDAVKDAVVFDDELDDLARDLPGSRAKVNGKVFSKWPPQPLKLPQPAALKYQAATKRKERPTAVHRKDREPATGLAARNRSSATFFDIQPLPAFANGRPPVLTPPSVSESSETEDLESLTRRHTAGKRIEDVVKCLLGVPGSPSGDDCEASDTESATESGYESEVNSSDPADYCYWIWHVMRREYTTEDEENGFEIDDIGWQMCGKEYDDLEIANAAAGEESRSQVPGGLDFHSSPGWTSSRTIHEVNCAFYTVTSHDVGGTLQVAVFPYLRTTHDRILPPSKAGWINSTLYGVKVRNTTISRTVDDVLGETTNNVTTAEAIANDSWTSHLEQANTRAAKTFVNLTMSRTLNLNQNDGEKAKRVEILMWELADTAGDEDPKFKQSFEFAESGRKVEVETVESRLGGPRNQFQFARGRRPDHGGDMNMS